MDKGMSGMSNVVENKHFLGFLRRVGIVLCTSILVLLSFPKAFANRFNTETSSSTRGLGMGNAVINTERGSYSVFYNPANIAAKNTETQLQPINVQSDITDNVMGSFALPSSYFTNLNLALLYKGALEKDPHAFKAARYSVYPNFTFRNFSIGMLYELNQGAEYEKHTTGAVRVFARNRFAPVGALSFRLLAGILRVGANVQLLTVGEANTRIMPPYDSKSISFRRVIDSGTGLQKNAGVTLTLPIRYLPSVSVVARDIGGTTFAGAPRVGFGDGRNVTSREMTVDVAAAMVVYVGRPVELKLEYDHKDYFSKLNGKGLERTNIGAELLFFDLFALRGGMSHGYWSAGFGMITPRMSVEFAMYSDELEGRFRQREVKRYSLQFTWSLFK